VIDAAKIMKLKLRIAASDLEELVRSISGFAQARGAVSDREDEPGSVDCDLYDQRNRE